MRVRVSVGLSEAEHSPGPGAHLSGVGAGRGAVWLRDLSTFQRLQAATVSNLNWQGPGLCPVSSSAQKGAEELALALERLIPTGEARLVLPSQ